jgi:glycogen operon protein
MVLRMIMDSLRYWVEVMHVDGFRFDLCATLGRTASVNLLTAHDGFTLTDVVSYSQRHNLANGEGNRDGHSANWSDNMGEEGPSSDPDIRTARARRKRNMLATLLLSQGTPMILAGDEIGNSQSGNNNAYCQDNEIGWIGWHSVEEDLLAFTRAMIAFRRAHPILRQKRFLHARERAVDGLPDLFWWREDGQEMTDNDWEDADRRLLCVEKRTAAGTPRYAAEPAAILLIFNAGPEAEVVLPKPAKGKHWVCRIDTSVEPSATDRGLKRSVPCPADAVLALVLEPRA